MVVIEFTEIKEMMTFPRGTLVRIQQRVRRGILQERGRRAGKREEGED